MVPTPKPNSMTSSCPSLSLWVSSAQANRATNRFPKVPKCILRILNTLWCHYKIICYNSDGKPSQGFFERSNGGAQSCFIRPLDLRFSFISNVHIKPFGPLKENLNYNQNHISQSLQTRGWVRRYWAIGWSSKHTGYKTSASNLDNIKTETETIYNRYCKYYCFIIQFGEGIHIYKDIWKRLAG